MAVSSGIAMDIHYCMGKRAGIDFYKTENDRCGRCGMKEKKKGCCHDEIKFHKLEDSHKNVYNNISFNAGDQAVVQEFPVYKWKLANDPTKYIINNNSPSDYTGPPICIMNCIFRL
jgi:hypothetical protein